MEVAVEVDMSSRITLRKAVLELLKKTGSNSTVESQISENAGNNKQHDRNSRNSRERNSDEDVTLCWNSL